MRPLAVDLVLLRSTAPDLPLVVGRVLAARVVERRGQHGVINLAGAYLSAELPEEIQAGDRLRLVVQDTSGGRVTFALAQDPPPLAQPPAVPGDRVTLHGRDDGEAGDEEGRPHAVTVRFESEAIGTVELRLALDERLVHARAAFRDGPALTLARERAEGLRAALAAATGRSAEVEILVRPERVDVYG
jgi:hypothetical protein